MQKIVYFCPVDWRWIKQRPQFLAEQLQGYGEVSVIYPWRNRRKGLQKKTEASVRLHPYFVLPTFGRSVPVVENFNHIIGKKQIANRLRVEKPQILWLTMPWQIDLIPQNAGCPIVYDCMDDYAAISMQEGGRQRIQEREAELVRKASLIFVSSLHLMSLLKERYGVEHRKLCLLRNGYSAGWPKYSRHDALPSGRLRIGYFGTIGRWFDFDAILESLSAFENVEYHLYGPTEKGVVSPRHERIAEHGVVEHDRIPEYAEELDVLIMPFIPNEIVQSVDPVKLYEYIFLNKHILCIRYPEIERFEPFVEFYDTGETYMEQLRRLLEERPAVKYTPQQAEAFLKENSWTKRAECAARKLEGLKMGER